MPGLLQTPGQPTHRSQTISLNMIAKKIASGIHCNIETGFVSVLPPSRMPILFHAVPPRHDLPCVLVVSAYELDDVALSVAPQFQARAQIRIERGNLDRGVELVKNAVAQDGVEVVVSAGSNPWPR